MKTLIAASEMKFNIVVDGHRLTLADAITELARAKDELANGYTDTRWDAYCYWRRKVQQGEYARKRAEERSND